MRQICELIKSAINDADSETRAAGRRAFAKLDEMHSEEADALYLELDHSKQKMLRGGDAASSWASVNSEKGSIPIRSKLSAGSKAHMNISASKFLISNWMFKVTLKQNFSRKEVRLQLIQKLQSLLDLVDWFVRLLQKQWQGKILHQLDVSILILYLCFSKLSCFPPKFHIQTGPDLEQEHLQLLPPTLVTHLQPEGILHYHQKHRKLESNMETGLSLQNLECRILPTMMSFYYRFE